MSLPNWENRGRLLYFPTLDTNNPIPDVYTIGWRILYANGNDEWSWRFKGFKDRKRVDVKGCAKILRDAVMDIMKHHNFANDETGIVTALSSQNTESDPKTILYKAGKWISEQTDTEWRPYIYTKKKHKTLHKLDSAEERDNEVAGKYTCKKCDELSQIIIIDDFVTRGSTLAEMYRALLDSNKSVSVICLALGKHINTRHFNLDIATLGVNNSHIPAKWESYWEKGGK